MPGTGRRSRRGFVLPTTILVVTMMTVMLAAAFILVSADYRTTDNAFATARSLAIAQAGLQTYFSAGHNLVGHSSDSTAFGFSDGYAVVVAQKIRDSVTAPSPVAPSLWVVSATGFDTLKAQRGQPNGQRAVAQFATLQPGRLFARAALSAPNGIQVQGTGANPLSGTDLGTAVTGCTRPPLTPTDTTPVTVPTAKYNGATNGSGGFPAKPDPWIASVEYLASTEAVTDSTRIDWASLLNGQFTPDFVGTWPAPCSGANCPYYAYYWTGDVTIPTLQRRGLLVATGNVTLASGTHWDGIIIAGGQLDMSCNACGYIVHGMVITGLNTIQGTAVNPNQMKRGSGTLQWDWCYAHASIATQSFLVPLKNAWVDTWSTY